MVHEYREALCLAHAETIGGWPIKVDLSNFGNEWTECIDQEWLKVLLSQTSFGHISINSPSILTVSMATESP